MGPVGWLLHVHAARPQPAPALGRRALKVQRMHTGAQPVLCSVAHTFCSSRCLSADEECGAQCMRLLQGAGCTPCVGAAAALLLPSEGAVRIDLGRSGACSSQHGCGAADVQLVLQRGSDFMRAGVQPSDSSAQAVLCTARAWGAHWGTVCMHPAPTTVCGCWRNSLMRLTVCVCCCAAWSVHVRVDAAALSRAQMRAMCAPQCVDCSAAATSSRCCAWGLNLSVAPTQGSRGAGAAVLCAAAMQHNSVGTQRQSPCRALLSTAGACSGMPGQQHLPRGLLAVCCGSRGR